MFLKYFHELIFVFKINKLFTLNQRQPPKSPGGGLYWKSFILILFKKQILASPPPGDLGGYVEYQKLQYPCSLCENLLKRVFFMARFLHELYNRYLSI
jgi:hypothetical protein